MNKKVIKSILSKKIKDWADSIDDPAVKNKVLKDTIVTGGCIASMLLNEEIKDFDIYFRTRETTKAVADYYVKKFNEKHKGKKNKLGHPIEAFVLDGKDVQMWKDGIIQIEDFAPGYENQQYNGTDCGVSRMIANCTPERVKVIFRSDGVVASEDSGVDLENSFEDVYDQLNSADNIPAEELENQDSGVDKYRPLFMSTNAITLSNKIQIVIRFHGNPEEIHKNYDFIHCTNYWTSDNQQLVLKQEALECLLSKQLKYQGSKYPLCSIIRTRKFIKRGFHINAGEYLKMCFQLSQLDLTDIDVLEDQLVGVDSAYFSILIDGLRDQMKTNPNFKIESSYVATIIDKIF